MEKLAKEAIPFLVLLASGFILQETYYFIKRRFKKMNGILEKQVELAERQAVALERIAEALESFVVTKIEHKEETVTTPEAPKEEVKAPAKKRAPVKADKPMPEVAKDVELQAAPVEAPKEENIPTVEAKLVSPLDDAFSPAEAVRPIPTVQDIITALTDFAKETNDQTQAYNILVSCGAQKVSLLTEAQRVLVLEKIAQVRALKL